MTYDLICIACPRGCNLHVEVNGDEIVVSGNTCKRGVTYAQEEVTNPTRIVTSSVQIDGIEEMVSVKTNQPIPKDKITPCLEAIKKLKLSHVPTFHEAVITNVCGTGADIIVTKG